VKALAEAIEKGLTEPAEVKKPNLAARPLKAKPPASKRTVAILPYLEKEVATLPEADRAGAVLESIKRVLPLGADLRTLGLVAWALDYFPSRSAKADERRAADLLRARVFAPLRKRRPPPPMPGRDDPAWAAILGGSFRMGSPPGEGFHDERLTHQLAISPFRLGIYAVTEADYARLAGESGKAANLPATGMDWYSAYAYAAWLGGRLSTEAEWEYAARGGTEHEYADPLRQENDARQGRLV
jgi:formylglycine-generating enzyme required for sulfatase activity